MICNGEKNNCIIIADDYVPFDPELFNLPAHYKDAVANIMIPHGLIMDRTEKLAADIVEAHPCNESLLVLCVLKGGYQFFSDLMDKMKFITQCNNRPLPMTVEFIRLKSYTNESQGELKITGIDDFSALTGRNVLVVEDLIDTGKTMVSLLNILDKHQPKSVKVATLLLKRNDRSNNYKPHYPGFEIPYEFIVGYACDYNEYFRDLQHICVMNEEGKKKYAI